MRHAALIDHRETRSVKFLTRRLAVAAAWSTLTISAVIAGTPEEDFRTGLSAFNGGDFATALRLWRPLAEGNDARSQAGVGFMYHRGLGVKTDDVQAAFWLRKAAEQGQAEGQMMLGTLYFFGLGVPQNYATAYAWCELAQDNGQGEAQMCRDAALQSLTEDAQLREAFRMVRELRERLGHVSGR
jgi:TPR repeat protein